MWQRDHVMDDGRIVLASTTVANGRHRAVVSDRGGRLSFPCPDAETARQWADDVVVKGYRHTCAIGCGDWMRDTRVSSF